MSNEQLAELLRREIEEMEHDLKTSMTSALNAIRVKEDYMSEEQQAPERIWIDPHDQTFWNSTGHVRGLIEYAPVVQSATAEIVFDWALRELADGWISNNEREGEYGFYQNARRVLSAIANDAAQLQREVDASIVESAVSRLAYIGISEGNWHELIKIPAAIRKQQ